MLFEPPRVKLYPSVYPAKSLTMIGEYYLMLTSRCPECNSMIEITKIPDIGAVVHCTNCHRELTVTWLYPITLDYDLQEKSPYLSVGLEMESNGNNLGTS